MDLMGDDHIASILHPGEHPLVFRGEQVVRISDLHFGARWKYMGERRRWRSLIPRAPITMQPLDWGRVHVCTECRGMGTITHTPKPRKGKPRPRTHLCRDCGLYRTVLVHRVRGPRQRQWDHANLVAACRPLIDTLVEQFWLVDDAPQFMRAEYVDEYRADQRGMVVLLGKPKPKEDRA